MEHRFHSYLLAAILGLVAGFVACLAAGAVLGIDRIEGIDLARDLPGSGLWSPAAIIGLRLVAALVGVVPSSPVLLAAGAT